MHPSSSLDPDSYHHHVTSTPTSSTSIHHYHSDDDNDILSLCVSLNISPRHYPHSASPWTPTSQSFSSYIRHPHQKHHPSSPSSRLFLSSPEPPQTQHLTLSPVHKAPSFSLPPHQTRPFNRIVTRQAERHRTPAARRSTLTSTRILLGTLRWLRQCDALVKVVSLHAVALLPSAHLLTDEETLLTDEETLLTDEAELRDRLLSVLRAHILRSIFTPWSRLARTAFNVLRHHHHRTLRRALRRIDELSFSSRLCRGLLVSGRNQYIGRLMLRSIHSLRASCIQRRLSRDASVASAACRMLRLMYRWREKTIRRKHRTYSNIKRPDNETILRALAQWWRHAILARRTAELGEQLRRRALVAAIESWHTSARKTSSRRRHVLRVLQSRALRHHWRYLCDSLASLAKHRLALHRALSARSRVALLRLRRVARDGGIVLAARKRRLGEVTLRWRALVAAGRQNRYAVGRCLVVMMQCARIVRMSRCVLAAGLRRAGSAFSHWRLVAVTGLAAARVSAEQLENNRITRRAICIWNKELLMRRRWRRAAARKALRLLWNAAALRRRSAEGTAEARMAALKLRLGLARLVGRMKSRQSLVHVLGSAFRRLRASVVTRLSQRLVWSRAIDAKPDDVRKTAAIHRLLEYVARRVRGRRRAEIFGPGAAAVVIDDKTLGGTDVTIGVRREEAYAVARTNRWARSMLGQWVAAARRRRWRDLADSHRLVCMIRCWVCNREFRGRYRVGMDKASAYRLRRLLARWRISRQHRLKRHLETDAMLLRFRGKRFISRWFRRAMMMRRRLRVSAEAGVAHKRNRDLAIAIITLRALADI